jgi:hypothetical protein
VKILRKNFSIYRGSPKPKRKKIVGADPLRLTDKNGVYIVINFYLGKRFSKDDCTLKIKKMSR